MGLNVDEKKAVVAEVSAQLANAQTLVVAEFRGVEVGDLTKLRANARKSGVYLRVLKNTLVRRAVQGTSFEALAAEARGLRADQETVRLDVRLASGEAGTYRVSVVDLSDVFDDSDEPIYYDNVHHNELGAKLIAGAMFDEIEDRLARLAEEAS